MKNMIEAIKTKKSIHYITICIIGLLMSIPLIWLQIRNTDDGSLHLIRIIGLNNAIYEGYFPFLVFPHFCNDWGYSMIAFYPTLVSFIPCFLGIISHSFTTGLKLFALLTTILSGIFMYNFVNEVTKKKAIAFFASIIYMTFPYKLEDIYNRFAIGEFTAFVFIPLVFQGLYNLLHGNKKRHFYITIGAVGLLLSHTISTLYTVVLCIIYILLNFKSFFKKDVIKKCCINLIFILLISAIFLIPMLEFKSQAEYAIFTPETMRTNSDYTAKNTIEFWQLLKNKNEVNGVSFIVGIPFLVMLATTILIYNRIDKKYKDFYIINIILGIISTFMCTNLFPWKIMPDFLCTIQYPWRMLGFAFFFFIPVCSINVYYTIKCIKKEWIQNVVYVIAFLILIIFTAIELTEYKVEDTSIDKKYEEYINNHNLHYFSVNRDYMPLKAITKQHGYLLDRGNSTHILSGKADIIKEEKDALHLRINIVEAQKETELELPYLFYPGYTIKLQYNEIEEILDAKESNNGFIKITIPENITEGEIIVDYTGTLLEKCSYAISGISILIFIIYIVCSNKKYKEENNNKLNEKQN